MTQGTASGKLGDATQSLHRPVPWERGAANARCHLWAQQQPLPSRWLLASSCSPGRQPCLHSPAAGGRPQAPAVPSTPEPCSDTEQISGLLWFWALEGGWCWLLPAPCCGWMDTLPPSPVRSGVLSAGRAACSLLWESQRPFNLCRSLITWRNLVSWLH